MEHVLYLGLDPERFCSKRQITHFPIIKIVQRPFSSLLPFFLKFSIYTHLIFTSRSAVKIFIEYAEEAGVKWEEKCVIAVGKATASLLKKCDYTAAIETAEGIILLLEKLFSKGEDPPHLFFPCSFLARTVIREYCEKHFIPLTQVVLYDTETVSGPFPSLDKFKEIVFTSPSTVKSFLEAYGSLPKEKRLTAIGPITQKTLDKFMHFTYRN